MLSVCVSGCTEMMLDGFMAMVMFQLLTHTHTHIRYIRKTKTYNSHPLHKTYYNVMLMLMYI